MSKGLEALDILINQLEMFDNTTKVSFESEYRTIEKELKALQIIKERRCNVADFIIDSPNCEGVMGDYEYWFNEMPTKEEYYLLKEVLLWD